MTDNEDDCREAQDNTPSLGPFTHEDEHELSGDESVVALRQFFDARKLMARKKGREIQTLRERFVHDAARCQADTNIDDVVVHCDEPAVMLVKVDGVERWVCATHLDILMREKFSKGEQATMTTDQVTKLVRDLLQHGAIVTVKIVVKTDA